MIVSPIVYILFVPVGLAALASLILAPVFPFNRVLRVTWLLLFFASSIGLIKAALGTDFSGADDIRWQGVPAWAGFASSVFAVTTPFVISFLAWWNGYRAGLKSRSIWFGVGLAVACLGPFLISNYANRQCIYFDYHHDTGSSWCDVRNWTRS